jgi:SAM-dependent methyltransferase
MTLRSGHSVDRATPRLRTGIGLADRQRFHQTQAAEVPRVAMPVADEILSYYARGCEDGRLIEDAVGQLEQLRTRELLLRWLPPPPGVVFDVGGGTGRYAVWLAERGYAVHLVDPVALHVEQAQCHSAIAARPLAGARVGDALSIDAPDGSAGAVLLLGPLYHLTRRQERVAALREAARVVRPGGFVLCAVISRFASALDGLSKHLLDDPIFTTIVKQDLADGQHRDGLSDGTRGAQPYFTTAYLHRPEDVADELTEAGLGHEVTIAIEGPAWLLQDLQEQWQDTRRRSAMLDIVRAVEAEPSLQGASSHLFAVGRRPE